MDRTFKAVLLAAALAPPLALAQEANSPTQQDRATAQQQVAPAENLSAADFATQAASSNMLEIQSSQLALEQSQNEQLRQFAQQMVDDHTKAAERLQAAAQGQGAAIPANMTEPHAQQLEELRNAQGEDFDQRYLQMQLQAHQQAVALHENYAQQGEEGELKQFAAETVPTLRSHLEQVQQIGNEVMPDQMAEGQQAQEGSRIVVERDAPRVHVEQASPRISVRQAQPEVSVEQPQPELIVHQPAPTITIDIPQPQITVRMPEPNVRVSQARPEVQVQQPQPQVQIQEAQQPEVEVEGAQPIASIEGNENQQPRVNYQQAEGQPTVQYESEEPNIQVNRAEGGPEVRVERLSDNAQGQAGQQPAQQGQQNLQDQPAAQQQPADSQANLRARFGMDDPNQQQRNRESAEMRELTVTDIEGMDVYNANGERIGDVNSVVRDGNNQQFIVITEGGFFGIGEDRAILPIERLWVHEDRLVAHGVTETDIENLDDYRGQEENYQELDGDTRASVGVWQ